jgi:hypothetical protein
MRRREIINTFEYDNIDNDLIQILKTDPYLLGYWVTRPLIVNK